MLDRQLINFRRLQKNDLKYMHKWLNHGLVAKWYSKKQLTMEEVVEKYLPYINNEKPTQAYLILYDDNPVGYIQTYKIEDYPEYLKVIDIEENASGIDLFIGEEKYINRGLGKYIISKFLEEIVFNFFDSESCILGPEPGNIAAIKTYEKVGFKHVKTVQTEDGFEYVMRIGKDEFQPLNQTNQ